MAGCWAERMVVARVGSSAANMAELTRGLAGRLAGWLAAGLR